MNQHLVDYINLDRFVPKLGKDGKKEKELIEGGRTDVEKDNALHLVLKNGHIKALKYFMKTRNIKDAMRARNTIGNMPMHSLAMNIFSSADEFEQIFRILTTNQDGFD